MTPRELAASFEAAGWRRERDRERDTWLAWHVAALTRAKRMPELAEMLNPGRTRRLSREEYRRRKAEQAELVKRMLGKGDGG